MVGDGERRRAALPVDDGVGAVVHQDLREARAIPWIYMAAPVGISGAAEEKDARVLGGRLERGDHAVEHLGHLDALRRHGDASGFDAPRY